MLINYSIYMLGFFFLNFILENLFSFGPEGLILELQPCSEGNLQAGLDLILQWFCRLLCLYEVCQTSEAA